MSKIFILAWTEHTKGFGARGDGYTLHSSPDARETLIKNIKKYNDDHVTFSYREFPAIENDFLYRKVLEAGGVFNTDQVIW